MTSIIFNQATKVEEETYVEMYEDGSGPVTPRHPPQSKIPILARTHKKDLDTTLTGESPESPRYCEIQEPASEQAHYEYLYKARTPSTQYEQLYQEIEETNSCEQQQQLQQVVVTRGSKNSQQQQQNEVKKKSTSKKKELEPLRPIEGRFGLNISFYFKIFF